MAIFALPFTIQLYNDKLAFLHRWAGRLIWLVSALHVTLWSIQLSRDKRSSFDPTSAFSFAFDYTKFIYGWVGFISLTLLVILSIRPIRVEIYETFYVLHVLLVPLTIAFSALHFPPIAWWCWSTLVLWGAERLWRMVKFLRVNGLLGCMGGRRKERYLSHTNARPLSVFNKFNNVLNSGHLRRKSQPRDLTINTQELGIIDDSSRLNNRPQSVGAESLKSFRSGNSAAPLMASSPGYTLTPTPIHPAFHPHSRMAGYAGRGTYLPPPGYAHATLLPGRTIRLRLVPPHHFSWAPGQYVQLTIPGISLFKTHPFTIASVCDQESRLDDGREILLLIRARAGFTKDLWNYIEKLELEGKIGDKPDIQFTPPRRGVLLRAYIDGPFGSSIRAPWTSYSTVLVIAGGSGIAFGTAIMEYACLCLTGRDSKVLGSKAGGIFGGSSSQIRRVRLVWVIREFSHMQWVASIIRRCLDLIKSNALQIDIFVTNASDQPKEASTEPKLDSSHLAPPNVQYMRAGDQSLNPSQVSFNSDAANVGWDPQNELDGIPRIK
ncbi:hypothetical protein M422DRAFT_252545 [Sphaerobolus stellatus SS14]|uniref:ferric-chelate reductase (NADPH) n=1 Tax=Sphaerobolus stellatus (strain SS14) TaxID=990650 RepID=A0A0C9VPJ3_SPHS4|nr:hypothetical protein M422DRAFT_252545 [Sphaerobolus stellatus SS14]